MWVLSVLHYIMVLVKKKKKNGSSYSSLYVGNTEYGNSLFHHVKPKHRWLIATLGCEFSNYLSDVQFPTVLHSVVMWGNHDLRKFILVFFYY